MTSLIPKIRLFLALLVAGTLLGCEPPVPEGTPVPAGTTATYKIGGHLYHAEVSHSEGGYVLWQFQWKKQVVYKQKTYRGILSVYNEEEGFKSWNKFDPAIVDGLFPLTVGKTLTVNGRHYAQRDNVEFPFAVTITVRNKADVTLSGNKYPVFIVEYAFVEKHPQGDREYTRIDWYSPALETPLRSDFSSGNKTFTIKIIALDEPADAQEEREGEPDLGTVRL